MIKSYKLRPLRLLAGYSQEEMAEKLGYASKSGYNMLEKSLETEGLKLSLDKANKIAEIFGLPINEIFFDDEVQETQTF